MEQKPSVGRVVHYFDGLNHMAATIVELISPSSNQCKLAVLNPQTEKLEFKSEVPYEAQPRNANTWHWPERV